jgi:hypothetical protein
LNKQRSVAFQLILLFTVASGLLLACGLGIFYSIVVRHAVAEDNSVLADKMFALSADLRENGPEILAEEVTAHPRRPAYALLDQDSRLTGPRHCRNTANGSIDSGTDFSSRARTGRKPFAHARIIAAQESFFALVTFNEHPAGKAYTLQLAQDRSSDEQVERNFALLFIAVLVGGVVASALIAIVVTRRGLRPLREMTESLRQMGQTN